MEGTARDLVRRTVLVAAAAVLALTGCAETGEPQQISLTEPRELTATGLTQTVVPAGDGFTSVTVTVGTYGVIGADAVLRLDVTGAGQQRTAFIDARSFATDPVTTTFTFPPIEDAAGQEFALRFSAEGEPVALFANEHDPYAAGQLRPGGGDLRFLLGHADRVEGTVEALGRVADDTGGNLASDPAFTAGWAAAIVALLAGLFVHRRRTRSATPAD